jgi:hypothetical protein
LVKHSAVPSSQVDNIETWFSRQKAEKIQIIKRIEMFVMLSILVGNSIVSGFWVEDFGVFAIVGHYKKISDDYKRFRRISPDDFGRYLATFSAGFSFF